MRVFAVVGALSVLSGCVATTAPEAGDWKIERGHDRILGKPAGVAQVSARSRNERQQQLSYPKLQLQTGSLQLGCFDNAPVVRLAFNHRVGSNRTSTLSYRFDDKQGHDAQVRFLETFSTAVMEDPKEVALFVEQLRSSGTLYVRVMSHVAGTTTVEFPLKGAPLAIETAYQACPVDWLKPRTAGASAPELPRSVPS